MRPPDREDPAPPPGAPGPDVSDPDRARVRAPGLRARTARGTIVNALFNLALEGLRTLRGFVIASIIAVAEFGLYGILVAILATLLALKSVGIQDRFIQQVERDQELAFQRALTLELGIAALFVVLFAGLAPLLAVGFDESELAWLTLTLAAVPPAVALQAPQWIYYRRMHFLRQRVLQAVEPVVGFGVAISLALAGMGVWSLVLAAVAGAWASAAASVVACPYRIRIRFDREVLRDYFDFSWPLFVGALAALVMAQSTAIVGFAAVGLAGVGALALGASIVAYANQADLIITGTMYPAICAVQDRPRALLDAFVLSNRLVMLWAFPVGVGLVLFGPELVTTLLGEKWAPASIVIQTFGLAAAVNQVAYNWTAFYRARGETRPIAVFAVVTAGVYVVVALPLLAVYELDGVGAGMLIATAAGLAVRLGYVHRLFPRAGLSAMIARAAAPTLAAAASALLLRHVVGTDELALEAAAFLTVLVAWILTVERRLMSEAVGYLGRAAEPA